MTGASASQDLLACGYKTKSADPVPGYRESKANLLIMIVCSRIGASLVCDSCNLWELSHETIYNGSVFRDPMTVGQELLNKMSIIITLLLSSPGSQSVLHPFALSMDRPSSEDDLHLDIYDSAPAARSPPSPVS
jgi:hypothetical protein